MVVTMVAETAHSGDYQLPPCFRLPLSLTEYSHFSNTYVKLFIPKRFSWKPGSFSAKKQAEEDQWIMVLGLYEYF